LIARLPSIREVADATLESVKGPKYLLTRRSPTLRQTSTPTNIGCDDTYRPPLRVRTGRQYHWHTRSAFILAITQGSASVTLCPKPSLPMSPVRNPNILKPSRTSSLHMGPRVFLTLGPLYTPTYGRAMLWTAEILRLPFQGYRDCS